jgi:hypothetical protein
VLLPVALWLTGRWLLLAQAVELEDASALGALRRSSRLVRGRWFRTLSLAGVGAGAVLLLGPILGVLLIFATNAPFALVNVVAGVVYAVAMPFAALITSYVYYDAIVREQLEPRADDELPAELPADAR